MAPGWWCAILLLVLVRMRAAAFNIDTQHAIVLGGPEGSYFGYSVALQEQGPQDASVVVGAPRARSLIPKDARFVEPGAVYECKRSQTIWKCQALDLGPSRMIQNFAGLKYNLTKDNAGYGTSLYTSATSNAPLVTCGPGLKNVIENHYFMNGICFILTNGYSSFKLPLIENDKQDYNISVSLYAYGEAGISVHLKEDASEFLIGAPGVLNWKGTVIKYSINDMDNGPTIPDTTQMTDLDEDDYFGFSVSSGKFFSSSTLYVSGAPRSAVMYGKVLVFSYSERDWQPLKIHVRLVGRQMGEYFGSVLCVVDLNADGLDDLVVGAPRHSLEGSQAGDEGRVYVYLSRADEKMIDGSTMAIMGSSYPSANFGTSIVSLGDINMDGYKDIAVGAPYEDTGAVYIYHGSRDGLKSQYAQRILAANIATQVPLSSFGFSISPGLDIDGNSYNDLVVGAYNSDQIVILRSRPVVHLLGSLTANVTMISLNDLAFSFSACIHYTGHFLPSELGIAATMKLDPEFNRIIVDGESVLSYNTTVYNNTQDCKNYAVKIKAGVDNFANPINVSLDLSMLNPLVVAGSTVNGDFCQSCPVVDPDNHGTAMSVLFDNGCGGDAVCQTDLAVHVELINITQPFILDPEKSLKVAVNVTNTREPAYMSRFTLETSGEVSIVKMPSSCQQLFDASVLRLECSLGHKPLKNTSQPLAVVLELGLNKVIANTTEIVFNVTADSSGEEETPSNNTELLHLAIFTNSEPILAGRPKPATLYFTQKSDDIVMFTHVYEVRNSGPSPMSSVNLEFLIPTAAVVGGKSTKVIDIDGVIGQLGSRHLNCTWREGAASDITTEGNSNTTLQLSCEQQPASCAAVTCHGVGPFTTTRTAAAISMHMRALPTPLNAALGQKKFIQVSSIGRAIYLLPQNAIKRNSSSMEGMLVATASATSVLIADVAEEKVEPWILLLAILAGLLILLLIALGMYKAGFFSRRRKDYDELHEGTVLNKDVGDSPRESTRLSHH